jgi:hypothetical protein
MNQRPMARRTSLLVHGTLFVYLHCALGDKLNTELATIQFFVELCIFKCCRNAIIQFKIAWELQSLLLGRSKQDIN